MLADAGMVHEEVSHVLSIRHRYLRSPRDLHRAAGPRRVGVRQSIL